MPNPFENTATLDSDDRMTGESLGGQNHHEDSDPTDVSGEDFDYDAWDEEWN